MSFRKLLLSLSLVLLCGTAFAKDEPRSFSLSTSRTFAPGESVKIQLFSRNVPEFEFRVYKVRDAEKFFAGLKGLHSFNTASSSPEEQIDQETLLERIHDWKAHLWYRVRHFFRGQFNDEARDSFREEQGKLGKRSKVVAASQYAQIPILNQSQLVARWKLQTPPAVVSETQQLPIDGLDSGVYLIEATDGTYKAYTVAIVTRLAVVERSGNGGASLFVADRKTGAPVADADVALWTGHTHQASGKTNADGLAELKMQVRGGAQGATPEDVWILAQHGGDRALVTPWGYGFSESSGRDYTSYIYTDRPVYRPGQTVHIKAIVRQNLDDTVVLPGTKQFTFEVSDGDQGKLEGLGKWCRAPEAVTILPIAALQVLQRADTKADALCQLALCKAVALAESGKLCISHRGRCVRFLAGMRGLKSQACFYRAATITTEEGLGEGCQRYCQRLGTAGKRRGVGHLAAAIAPTRPRLIHGRG